MKIVHESDVQEVQVPGRYLRWIADSHSLQPEFLSSCVMRVLPGQTVKPAHAHPQGEELIYVISGEGKVCVDGEVKPLTTGTAVLFPKGSIHMVRNSGPSELKVICFFAPPSSLDTYEYHPEVSFPEETNEAKDTAGAARGKEAGRM
ncbi:MAG TPA: cupin domain-containing protein [Spirochaetales bacterium]|nr:cupin domain-containing protein [Spirochaetales bacterium]